VAVGWMSWFAALEAIAERRYGAARAWSAVWWAFLVIVGILPVLYLLAIWSGSGGDPWTVVVQFLLLANVAVAVWCASRIRRSTPLRPPTAFSWGDYAAAAAVPVGMHVALLWMYERMLSSPLGGALIDQLPPGWPRISPLVAVVMFLLAQISTAAALRGLTQALQKDWRRSGGEPLPRNRQYVLVALPLVIAAAVSVAAGIALAVGGAIPPLLGGLLGWLTALVVRWKYTDLPPTSPLGTLWNIIVRGSIRALR
jgi:hypothetical protein